jgi:hypothetical protein
MKEQFRQFLISKGYRVVTPNGHPSTVYDYLKRIDKVCELERLDNLTDLAKNITEIRLQYEPNGKKSELGAKSHNAVICALRQFEEFVNQKND